MGGPLEGAVISVTGNFDRQAASPPIPTPAALGRAVRRAGGRIDALVHKNLTFLVADANSLQLNTQRVRKAAKFHVPIVSEKFILACIAAGKDLLGVVSEKFILACIAAGKRIDHAPFLLKDTSAPDAADADAGGARKGGGG
ncbi:hypothetical protein T484DRAFT_1768401, partial [Baffinella frigidus]